MVTGDQQNQYPTDTVTANDNKLMRKMLKRDGSVIRNFSNRVETDVFL